MYKILKLHKKIPLHLLKASSLQTSFHGSWKYCASCQERGTIKQPYLAATPVDGKLCTTHMSVAGNRYLIGLKSYWTGGKTCLFTGNLPRFPRLVRSWTLEKIYYHHFTEQGKFLTTLKITSLDPQISIATTPHQRSNKWRPAQKTTGGHNVEVNRCWEAHLWVIHLHHSSCIYGSENITEDETKRL